MIALSFLGTGNYQEANYMDFEENMSFKTQFFPEALKHIYNPDEIYIAATEEAYNKHGNNLTSLIKFKHIPIPTGNSNEEILDIFSIISSAIPDNEKLLIDITHGFRSQPLIALSIAVFLRVVKNVSVSKIIYGAFEARKDDITPIFNITSFLNFIDWSYATELFIKKGNSSQLSFLLNDIHNKVRIKQEHFTNLQGFAKSLDKMTESITFIRPKAVSEFGKELQNKLEKTNKDIENYKEVLPLKLLLNKIPDSFKSLLLSEKQDLFSESGFNMQAEMIKYYLDTEQYVQAITLAREILASLICKRMSLKFTNRNDRLSAEERLNELCSFVSKGIKLEDELSMLAKLWGKIRDVRNDINHAGMREEAIPASTLKKNIIDYCNQTISLIPYAHQPKQSS